MKKILVFLIVFLTVSTSALAEPFQLHSGVQFGMTMEEVKEIETKAGYEVESGSTRLSIKAPALAGIGGWVYYNFDSENRLQMCQYSFGDFNDTSVSGLIDAYTAKYGTPLAEGKHYVDIGGEVPDALDDYINCEKPATLKKFYQWLPTLDDGSAVDIMLAEWNEKWPRLDIGGTFDMPRLRVSYSLRSADEIQTLLEENQEKEAARNADI